jgi:hypothetical protein
MSVLIHRLMRTVETTDYLNNPQDEFVAAAGSLLALAISKLAPTDREAFLQHLEDGGLRRLVERFPSARALPEVPGGTLQ